MGYYSDVAVGMNKNEAVKFLNEGAKIDGEGFVFKTDFQVIERNEYTIIRWPDIKWYDDYKDVAWVMEYLKKLSEEGKPVAFLTIGEAVEDVEAWYENDDDYSLYNTLRVRRYIDFEE